MSIRIPTTTGLRGVSVCYIALSRNYWPFPDSKSSLPINGQQKICEI
jgi:hypothetical protein